MKIVVLDDVDAAFRASGALSRLEAKCSLVIHDREAGSREEVLGRLKGAEVAVAIRDRTILDRETLASLSQLKLIASSGPHRIDLKAATELGIVVTSTPGVSTPSVGEHVFAMILALARRVPASDQALRQRSWEPIAGMELEGKTLGILGLGRTGGAVAKRAPAFGLNVIAWGPTLTPERAAACGAKMVTEGELFRVSDILSVHLRRSDMSRNFVNASRLSLMKSSALLIDISWAGIVNRKDLAQALKSGKLAGAALDLCDTFPISNDDPILDAPNTVLTPHLAWQTRESYNRAAKLTVESILSFLSGKPVNVVNADVLTSKTQR